MYECCYVLLNKFMLRPYLNINISIKIYFNKCMSNITKLKEHILLEMLRKKNIFQNKPKDLVCSAQVYAKVSWAKDDARDRRTSQTTEKKRFKTILNKIINYNINKIIESVLSVGQ